MRCRFSSTSAEPRWFAVRPIKFVRVIASFCDFISCQEIFFGRPVRQHVQSAGAAPVVRTLVIRRNHFEVWMAGGLRA